MEGVDVSGGVVGKVVVETREEDDVIDEVVGGGGTTTAAKVSGKRIGVGDLESRRIMRPQRTCRIISRHYLFRNAHNARA